MEAFPATVLWGPQEPLVPSGLGRHRQAQGEGASASQRRAFREEGLLRIGQGPVSLSWAGTGSGEFE